MKHIHTTATAVEKLKSEAKALQKDSGATHSAALEKIAVQHGYTNWHHVTTCLKESTVPTTHSQPQLTPAMIKNASASLELREIATGQRYMAMLKAQGTAKVHRYGPGREHRFHSVEIDGILFNASVQSDGLHISAFTKRIRGDILGSVALGVSSIHFTQDERRRTKENWHICKYGPKEARIAIGPLSNEGRMALAHEFGFRIWEKDEWVGTPEWEVESNRLFYLSPAFERLCDWAKAHPKIMAGCKPHNAYLGDWEPAALAGVPPWAMEPPMKIDLV